MRFFEPRRLRFGAAKIPTNSCGPGPMVVTSSVKFAFAYRAFWPSYELTK